MFNVLILACAIIVSIIIRQRWFSPLSSYPGPFLASITRAWYTYVMWRGDQHQVLPALHARYGPYVRVAPNEIHISDPDYLKPIYGAGSTFRKTDFFKVFQGNRKFDLVSERDPKIHASQRRLVAQVYSMSSVMKLEASIDHTLGLLIARFDARIGHPFDVSNWVQYWSFDTIGMMTFSKVFGFIEAGKDWNRALGQIRDAMDCAAWLGQHPKLYSLLERFIFPVTGNFFALANRHGSVRNFAIQQASERQSRRDSDRPDIMRGLLSVHTEKPEFDTDALQSMVTTNIFGGAETTTSSLRAAMYYLLKNPEAKTKLIREIDQHMEQALLSPGSVVPFTLTKTMVYLHAIIMEAMRLFPANGIPSARVAPDSGFEVNGRRVPCGTEICIFSWSLHRQESIFGPRADEFIPERWLDTRFDHALHNNFFSFGAGARGCLGRHLAWMEMTKCLATLFGRYDIQLADPNQDWTIEGSFIKGQRNINIVLSAR